MRDAGFTLIEVMVALTVMLIGMLGVMGMQYYAITGNTSSRDLRNATNLSQDVIEQVKATPFSMLASGADTPALDQATSGNVVFDRAWTVVPNCMALADDGTSFPPAAVCATVSTASTSISTVRVKTRWTDKNGIDHFVTLDTIKVDS